MQKRPVKPNGEIERKLWNEGYGLVIGLDEVGRGPLAGPVCAGGVLITDETQLVDGVWDSKKLTEKARNELSKEICARSAGWAVGMVDSADIDNVGIARAVQIAMSYVVSSIEEKIGKKADILIVDGAQVREIEGYENQRFAKGDMLHYSIAAGSIVAKVARDNLMKSISSKYPEYGFDSHVGYGTKQHREALYEIGPCKIHRFTFKPVSELVKKATYGQKKAWSYWGELGL
ncbi:ribonuclease HII [Candidatus Dojkabacteria bacterium]|nr:ribonuclease HII [Candidatus Dojkabacteria bacterium]